VDWQESLVPESITAFRGAQQGEPKTRDYSEQGTKLGTTVRFLQLLTDA
jgi:hypothetical protein